MCIMCSLCLQTVLAASLKDEAKERCEGAGRYDCLESLGGQSDNHKDTSVFSSLISGFSLIFESAFFYSFSFIKFSFLPSSDEIVKLQKSLAEKPACDCEKLKRENKDLHEERLRNAPKPPCDCEKLKREVRDLNDELERLRNAPKPACDCEKLKRETRGLKDELEQVTQEVEGERLKVPNELYAGTNTSCRLPRAATLVYAKYPDPSWTHLRAASRTLHVDLSTP